TIPSDFGWDDVGGWLAMERLWGKDKDGNSVKGNVIHADMKNTVVMGDKRLIAVLGAEDLIIVDTDDALLVCKKNDAQHIKGLIAELKKGDNLKYL
ncbi:MAG: mannose-1-phosphate guanylyltransferase/mannose-6-phosphate isomerase, partial [Mucispirillum sp.]|nr:mannose-1-phosphate guanylyltransferase/mannose-6-phosphate isomerase [Mucispirillum sp.]